MLEQELTIEQKTSPSRGRTPSLKYFNLWCQEQKAEQKVRDCENSGAERGSKKSGDARARSSSIIMISFWNKLPSAFIPERTRHNTLRLIIIYYTQNQQQQPAPKLISWVASIIIVNFLPGVVPLLEISQHWEPRRCSGSSPAIVCTADGYYFCVCRRKIM